MYKCQICGSRTCPTCLDCKSLGERKTGYYCNKYKVKLRKLAYPEQHPSTIDLLHNGAIACNYCLIDRGELLEETTPTLEVCEEDDEEPFPLPDPLDERYYLRYTPPNPESRITNQDILNALEIIESELEEDLR